MSWTDLVNPLGVLGIGVDRAASKAKTALNNGRRRGLSPHGRALVRHIPLAGKVLEELGVRPQPSISIPHGYRSPAAPDQWGDAFPRSQFAPEQGAIIGDQPGESYRPDGPLTPRPRSLANGWGDASGVDQRAGGNFRDPQSFENLTQQLQAIVQRQAAQGAADAYKATPRGGVRNRLDLLLDAKEHGSRGNEAPRDRAGMEAMRAIAQAQLAAQRRKASGAPNPLDSRVYGGRFR